MSTIENIFVQLRHFRLRGQAVFGEVVRMTSHNMFEIKCGDAVGEYNELIDANSWNIEEIEVDFRNSDVPEKVYPGSSADGWERVRTLIKRRNQQQHQSSIIIQPQTYGNSRRKTRWVRGCEIHHDSMGEVVERYHDYKNAVAILPDSWFDKKLQEAYLSKRKATKEPENE